MSTFQSRRRSMSVRPSSTEVTVVSSAVVVEVQRSSTILARSQSVALPWCTFTHSGRPSGGAGCGEWS